MPESNPPASGAPDAVPDAALARARADYDRLFNLSLDLLCIAGLDGYFKRVNPSWTRVLGWSEAELLARPVADFIHPDDRERTVAARRRLAQGEPLREFENRYLCKDGSIRWFAWQSVAESEAAAVFAVARDVTDRRQLEEQRILRSKLESAAILAGGLTHDFNNLFTAMLLNVEMAALTDPVTTRQEQHLARAREAIMAARVLTGQLSAFAAGEPAVRVAVELEGLLRRALAAALAGSPVQSECTVAADLRPIEADPAQLVQLIGALVRNAREAMPAGGTVRLDADNMTLAVAPGPDSEPGDYVRIRCSDSGAGIPADVLPKIFDPYFSTKPRNTQRGMGLGLTLCRTIVRGHGGTITAAARPGGGTVIECCLPVKSAPPA